jgi:hypothetical protein
MKPTKLIRELTEQRDRSLSKAMEGNRCPQIQIDDLYFCIDSRAGDSCGGILAKRAGESLSQIGSFSLLQGCEGFYTAEVLVTLEDDSFLPRFSESNLDGLLNRLRLRLGISGAGPARVVCVVGGVIHYSMTAANPDLL